MNLECSINQIFHFSLRKADIFWVCDAKQKPKTSWIPNPTYELSVFPDKMLIKCSRAKLERFYKKHTLVESFWPFHISHVKVSKMYVFILTFNSRYILHPNTTVFGHESVESQLLYGISLHCYHEILWLLESHLGHSLFLLLLLGGVEIVFCRGKNAYNVLCTELLPIKCACCVIMLPHH